jgi:ankyrin repeat protein
MEDNFSSNDRLYHAAANLKITEVRKELRNGDANINAIHKYDWGYWSTPLYEALSCTKALDKDKRQLAVDIAQLLISNGANASEKLHRGMTPLHMIAQRFPCTILLQRVFEMCPTTDANVKDDYGETPIVKLIDNQKAWSDCNPRLLGHTVSILLKHGADPRIQNRSGNTILHFCQDEAVISNVLAFNDGAFDINTRNQAGETPLFRGVRLHQNECPMLLENGADPTIPDRWGGDTLLHLKTNNEFMSKILKSPFQVDINALNKNHYSPLHQHVRHDNPDGVRFLLDAGARDTRSRFYRFTAEQMATWMYPDENSPMRRVFIDHHIKLAVCMASHSRLGSESWMRELYPDLLEKIYSYI